MGWTEYRASYFRSGKIDRKAECDAYFLESQAGILGNSITEMKAFLSNISLKNRVNLTERSKSCCYHTRHQLN